MVGSNALTKTRIGALAWDGGTIERTVGIGSSG
jgi:hypothetical protein